MMLSISGPDGAMTARRTMRLSDVRVQLQCAVLRSRDMEVADVGRLGWPTYHPSAGVDVDVHPVN